MQTSGSDDGNSKSDRYRASKMKLNEEYVIVCDLDMRNLVSSLYKKYEKEISLEEIEYYRRNLKPSRLQQQMIEIYFYNYTSSAQEFALLKNIDWFKLLLIMRKDIMKRFNVTNESLLDSPLVMLLTANITENPVGEKVYLKDTALVQETAMTVHRTLGLGNLSRTDLILDDAGTPWFIDVNVVPGMTETSLLPLAAEAEGGLPELYDALVRNPRVTPS